MNDTLSLEPPVERIHVWDRFVRAFHWSLVSCILINYFIMDDGETLHRLLGYTASALVLARIVWGFVGSRHARFADFFPTPARIRQHLHHLKTGTRDDHPGHNAVGAVMMLVMLALVVGSGDGVSAQARPTPPRTLSPMAPETAHAAVERVIFMMTPLFRGWLQPIAPR